MILDVVKCVFVEKGFEGVFIVDIVCVVGILDGLVYCYFCNKCDFFYGVFKKFYEWIFVDFENEVFKNRLFWVCFEVFIKCYIEVFVLDIDFCWLFIVEVWVVSDYEGLLI